MNGIIGILVQEFGDCVGVASLLHKSISFDASLASCGDISNRRHGRLFVGSMVMVCRRDWFVWFESNELMALACLLLQELLQPPPEVGGEVAGERGREKMVVVLCLFIKIRSRSKAT